MENNQISQDVIQLVVNRLESIPRNVEITIGDITIGGTYTIDQLIESVKRQDDVGIKMVEVQMAYLKSLNNRFSNSITA